MERDQNVRDRNRAGYDADLVDATLDNDEFLEETAAEVARPIVRITGTTAKRVTMPMLPADV